MLNVQAVSMFMTFRKVWIVVILFVKAAYFLSFIMVRTLMMHALVVLIYVPPDKSFDLQNF